MGRLIGLVFEPQKPAKDNPKNKPEGGTANAEDRQPSAGAGRKA